MIGIVDYSFGNISALRSTLNELGKKYKIVTEPSDLEDITHIIMPGVGSFDNVMRNLSSSGLKRSLCEKQNIKILGICIGMHILGHGSEEGTLPGLGLVPGKVIKLDNNIRKPHLGWNSVELISTSRLFRNINLQKGFYFLHNYVFISENNDMNIASTNYGGDITSAISNQGIYGVQFHPEKSGVNGKLLINNFCEL